MLQIIDNQQYHNPHTHKLVIQSLKKDLTVRKVEILYDGFEEWEHGFETPFEIGENILGNISMFFKNDKSSLGYKADIYELSSGKNIVNFKAQANSVVGGS